MVTLRYTVHGSVSAECSEELYLVVKEKDVKNVKND